MPRIPSKFPRLPTTRDGGALYRHSSRSVDMNAQTQRVARVTGGSRGLGRNAAESLARKGVDVVITYHSRVDEARTVVAGIEAQGRKAAALQLDSAAVATFDRFTETFKSTLRETWSRDRFDYLVNNGGISHHNAFDK